MLGPRSALPLWLVLYATLAACGGDDEPTTLEPTYDNVEAIVARSCAFNTSCHGGATGQARLNFALHLDAGEPITTAFENPDGSPRPSCEYDLMPVVDPGDPDNSWLMVKIEGDVTPDGLVDFTPATSWMPGTTDPQCPRTEGGDVTFGAVMPLMLGDPMPLPDREIAAIREWIAMGAPGP
jgi:hypothetical protein